MNVMNMPNIKLESNPSKSTTSSRSDYTKTDFKKYLENDKINKNKKQDLFKELDEEVHIKHDHKKTNEEINEQVENQSSVNDKEITKHEKTNANEVNSESNENDNTEDKNSEIDKNYEQIIRALLLELNGKLDYSNDFLKDKIRFLDGIKGLLTDKLKEFGITDITSNQNANKLINDIVTLLNDVEVNSNDMQFKKNIEDIINKYFSKASSENSDNQIITRLKSELATVYTESNNDINNSTNSESNSQNNSSENLFRDKSEKVLRSIIDEEDKSTKLIDRSANFMTQILKNEKIDVVKPQQNIVVNRSTFTQDIIKAVNFMNSNDIQNLSVKILPKELGEMFISVTIESGVMKAQISAANKETMNLLNAHMQDITDKLNNSNLKIQDVKIDIYNDDTTFFSQQFNQNNDGRQENNQSRNRNIRSTSNIAIDATDINEQSEQDSDANVNTLV